MLAASGHELVARKTARGREQKGAQIFSLGHSWHRVLTSLIATERKASLGDHRLLATTKRKLSVGTRAGLSVIIGYLVDAEAGVAISTQLKIDRVLVRSLSLLFGPSLRAVFGDRFPYREAPASAEATGSLPCPIRPAAALYLARPATYGECAARAVRISHAGPICAPPSRLQLSLADG
jgi:hypothetical protein